MCRITELFSPIYFRMDSFLTCQAFNPVLLRKEKKRCHCCLQEGKFNQFTMSTTPPLAADPANCSSRLGGIWTKLSDPKSSETTLDFWYKDKKNAFSLILLLKKAHCQGFEVYIVSLLKRKP